MSTSGDLSLLCDPSISYCVLAPLVATPTSYQQDVIVGTLLGDASAERAKMTYNTRLRFDQSYPAHHSYLMHLYYILKSLTRSEPKIITRAADKRTGLSYQSIAFKTAALPVLNQYRELFYVNGVKVVPANIQDLLTPVALAY